MGEAVFQMYPPRKTKERLAAIGAPIKLAAHLCRDKEGRPLSEVSMGLYLNEERGLSLYRQRALARCLRFLELQAKRAADAGIAIDWRNLEMLEIAWQKFQALEDSTQVIE